MARNHGLSDLMKQSKKLTAVNSSADDASEEPRLTGKDGDSKTSASRAIGAISRSFEEIKAQSVAELDPSDIDPPLIEDRIQVSGPKLDELIEQIRESGQQVPILVRPNPNGLHRYQIVFGWRRTQAAKSLGIKVKGIVKKLSDEESVVAQGQENNSRQDLTFIEKALYAQKLEQRGFKREIIMAALAVDKTVCSRLISATTNIPREIIDAIGSAPKVGRDRWAELAKLVLPNSSAPKIQTLASSENFKILSSDGRFDAVIKALSLARQTSPKVSTKTWKNTDGKKIASYSQNEKTTTLVIDRKQAPDFGNYIIESLPELYAAFESRQK